MKNAYFRYIFVLTCFFSYQAAAMVYEDERGNFFSRAWQSVKNKIFSPPPQQPTVESSLWEMIGHHYKPNDLIAKTTFTKECGFSVPSKEAIQDMKTFIGEDKCLEVGAGRGLWARLLQDEGVVVKATDATIPDNCFCKVEQLDARAAIENNRDFKTLLISWWPEDDQEVWWGAGDTPYNPSHLFTGDQIIYIGEAIGGCTGGMPNLKEWRTEKEITIPQLRGNNDVMLFFTRKKDGDVTEEEETSEEEDNVEEESVNLETFFGS